MFGSGEVLSAFAFAGVLRALAFEVFFFATLRALAFEVFFFAALRALDFRALFLATIAPLLAVIWLAIKGKLIAGFQDFQKLPQLL